MRKTDVAHYTYDEVRTVLVDALALVEDVAPPTDLRETTFTKACDLLAAKQVIIEQATLGLPNMAIPRGV